MSNTRTRLGTNITLTCGLPRLAAATLANSITLTPGTITVHVDPQERLLVMHAIDIGEDPESVREATRSALEANILRWTRAGRAGKGAGK